MRWSDARLGALDRVPDLLFKQTLFNLLELDCFVTAAITSQASNTFVMLGFNASKGLNCALNPLTTLHITQFHLENVTLTVELKLNLHEWRFQCNHRVNMNKNLKNLCAETSSNPMAFRIFDPLFSK